MILEKFINESMDSYIIKEEMYSEILRIARGECEELAACHSRLIVLG